MQSVMFNNNTPHTTVTPTVTTQQTTESGTDVKTSLTKPTETTASNHSDSQKESTIMEQLKESTEKFNKMSEELNLDVKFAYNEKIDQVYLNIIDKHTGRIIRKLPSEEAMKISESMKELVGALLDKRG